MTSYPCNKYEQITPSYLLSVNEIEKLERIYLLRTASRKITNTFSFEFEEGFGLWLWLYNKALIDQLVRSIREHIRTLVFVRTSLRSVRTSKLRSEYFPYGPHNWSIRAYCSRLLSPPAKSLLHVFGKFIRCTHDLHELASLSLFISISENSSSWILWISIELLSLVPQIKNHLSSFELGFLNIFRAKTCCVVVTRIVSVFTALQAWHIYMVRKNVQKPRSIRLLGWFVFSQSEKQ